MAKYLVTYHGVTHVDPAAMPQVREAFAKWVQGAGKAVIDPGAPINMVAQVSNGNPAPAADIGGYSIIEAQSTEEAVKILKMHPFVGRGGTLQVNEAMG